MTKNELRHSALESRRAIPRTRISDLSRLIDANLNALKEFQSAKSIASYVAMSDEVQTAPILKRLLSKGKTVAVPLIDSPSERLLFFRIQSLADLSIGRFGILEPRRQGHPIPLSQTDIVLVPLIAWDERGHRVGYGRGYFDRALAERGRSIAIGLAFESQSVAHVPDEESDVRLDMVVTEKRAVKFGRGAA
jgi:5-formyltetrahydrofolate cyclo-ligase